MIIEENAREKEELSKGITDITVPAEVAQASNPIDFVRKYMGQWVMLI